MIDAVADRRVDTAIVWGPVAGYFARRARVPLEVTRVAPLHEGNHLPFTFAMAMGVRRDDEALRVGLNSAIAAHTTEIQRVLREFGVPLEDGR